MLIDFHKLVTEFKLACQWDDESDVFIEFGDEFDNVSIRCKAKNLSFAEPEDGPAKMIVGLREDDGSTFGFVIDLDDSLVVDNPDTGEYTLNTPAGSLCIIF